MKCCYNLKIQENTTGMASTIKEMKGQGMPEDDFLSAPPAAGTRNVASSATDQDMASPGESGLGKAAPKKTMRIGEKLMSLGLVSADQVEIALREQAKSKKMLGQILVEMNFITESALGEVLAESAGA